MKTLLYVEVSARSKALLDEAIEALARSACDIANSYDSVHVIVTETKKRGPK